MLAGAAVTAGGNAASAVISHIIIRYLTGTFNPAYKKEDRRRIRYIQRKYALAYQSESASDDPSAIIASTDPNSKLLMAADGTKPANPFQDEPQFEESLTMNFHPISGHQGRFAASHALACIGAVNDYQNQRRSRPWIPGVSSPGHPNDYINMFLEETKTWMRNQMTLDTVHAEELARRDAFYTKLKNDNYFWCFPPETESKSIHKVIDFVHDKVKNALELISREEKNKSLQGFFKELNDHTTNAFEFGKQFLAFLLCASKKMGGNLSANTVFDGRSYETGKLHNLLESATRVVLESYVEDMALSQQRVSTPSVLAPIQSAYPTDASSQSQSLVVAGQRDSAGGYGATGSAIDRADTETAEQYLVDISDFEESTLRPVAYVIELVDPKGHRWVVRRTYAEFEALHGVVTAENQVQQPDRVEALGAAFPAKLPGRVFRNKDEYHGMCKLLQGYLINLLYVLVGLTSATQTAVCAFLEVKQLFLSPNSKLLRRAESVPNAFVALKRDFNALLVAKEEAKGGPSKTASASMAEFRRVWGIEMTIKVFDAYALLQRMATVLGWTLEINHFFISMFGNTLAFSKLPLRDIIFLQRDIMNSFLRHCTELFDFACQVNADSKYKWHKNLQMVENHLGRTKFHIEKALSIIALIDAEHLDYEVQMRRLRDVHARFQPLMNRIDGSLENIQEELNLPGTSTVPGIGNKEPRGVATSEAEAKESVRVTELQEVDRAPKGAVVVYQHGTPDCRRPAAAGSSGSSASQEVQEPSEHYIVQEPLDNDETATPIHAHRIFSRGQSPDVPTQALNPLQFVGEEGAGGGAGQADRQRGESSSLGIAERHNAQAKDDGEGQDGGCEAEGEGECGPGSKVCVIS